MATSQARIEITADDRTSRAFATIERNFKGLQSSAVGLSRAFVGLGGILSAGAFIDFTRNAISSAAALDDMAESTGATVEGLSKLTDIARIGGNDIGQVQTALTRLTKALSGTDDETKGAGEAIRNLGLDFDRLRALSPDKQIEEVAKAFARFADGGGKASNAIALLGKGGEQFLPLLKDIAEQSERVASLTAEQAAEAEKLEKNWNALAVSSSNWARALVSDLVPALNKFFELANKNNIGFGGAIDATLGYALRKKLGIGDKNIQTEIRAQSDKLAKMVVDREKSPLPSILGPSETDIENLRAYIAGLKEIASIEALAGAGAPYGNELRLPQLPYVQPPPKPTPKPKAEIPGLGMELPGFQDESVIRRNEELAKEAEALRNAIDPLQKYREELDRVRLLREKGLVTADEATEREFQIAEAMDKTLGIMEKMPDQVQKTNDLVNELGMTFSSAFEDAIIGGKALSDVLKALEQDIMKIVTRKLVTEPLAKGITGVLDGGTGSGIGGLFDKIFGGLVVSLFGAKNGGIFPGGFQSFASGGLVRQPTLGLVGEGAMNEAIVPLPNGRAIPVEMRGGGATVIMNISTPDVSGFRASQGQILADAQRALTRGRRNL